MRKLTSDSRIETPDDNIYGQQQLLQKQRNWSLVGGGVAALFVAGGLLLVGQVYSHIEAQQRIEAMTPAMQMLGFATTTATGTILALMLTMLGLLHESELNFKHGFYDGITRIAMLSTIDFIASVLLLSLVGIPFGEADGVPALWLTVLYYVLIFANAGISGLLVAISLMLFDTIKTMIETLKKRGD
jgi:hypothetical protein